MLGSYAAQQAQPSHYYRANTPSSILLRPYSSAQNASNNPKSAGLTPGSAGGGPVSLYSVPNLGGNPGSSINQRLLGTLHGPPPPNSAHDLTFPMQHLQGNVTPGSNTFGNHGVTLSNNGSHHSNNAVGSGKLLLTNKTGYGGMTSATPAVATSNAGLSGSDEVEEERVHSLIVDLLNPSLREGALLELSKKREQWDDLALVLWHSFGVMSCLLQEIVTVYPLLSPPTLTANASNRVCNALALLQCVASHNDTRGLFLQAHLPLFLYPFLNTTSKTRPFEYLRLTSLGVIGALVKQNENSDVINFLLSTEIIPLCLRIMETGSELSKTVAIFIVQKILLDDMGLAYICQTYERFSAVGTVLSNMVNQLVDSQAVRLLKHVVRCYLRLSDNLRAREALRACLPEPLRDATFSQVLKGDLVTKRCLASLLLNLSDRVE